MNRNVNVEYFSGSTQNVRVQSRGARATQRYERLARGRLQLSITLHGISANLCVVLAQRAVTTRMDRAMSGPGDRLQLP